ncbi:hypothetical protein RSAG8_05979, partial [Rhizoctonia solani AG-8 WAC10335]
MQRPSTVRYPRVCTAGLREFLYKYREPMLQLFLLRVLTCSDRTVTQSLTLSSAFTFEIYWHTMASVAGCSTGKTVKKATLGKAEVGIYSGRCFSPLIVS